MTDFLEKFGFFPFVYFVLDLWRINHCRAVSHAWNGVFLMGGFAGYTDSLFVAGHFNGFSFRDIDYI